MSTTQSRIGRYLRLEPIGRGAMGVVYRAEDPLIHRVVAIKVLHPAKGLDPHQYFVARERFRREAQTAGSIDHPHIVRIFDVGEDEEQGELYIVMEHLPGPSLERLIADAKLEIGSSVEIIGQIASALDAAHEQRIVHRDVKPSNILFTERGAAKIVDFGITQIASSSLTQDMSKLGTPAYMSPEQVSGKPIDARADLFSLGVLSYEILTGRKPFTGTDAVSIAFSIAHSNPPPISEGNPQLPASLDRVFALMMAKNPADRFASGKAFHEAIVRCLVEDSAKRRPPVARRRSRMGMYWALVGCALLAMSIVVLRMPSRSLDAPALASPAPGPAAAPTPVAAPAKASRAAAPPKGQVPVPTTRATISLTHRLREGTLVVSLDGASIFKEEFTKAKMAFSQTTTWDAVRVAAGKHTLKARVIARDGTTYLSDVYTVELPRSAETSFRIKFKGDKLVVQQS